MILKLLHDVREHMGTVTLEPLIDREVWPDARVRSFLTSFSGIGAKTASCILLYRLQRLDFAVDTNILKIGARMGWFKSINVTPEDALPTTARREILSHKSSGSVMSSSPAMSSSAESPSRPAPKRLRSRVQGNRMNSNAMGDFGSTSSSPSVDIEDFTSSSPIQQHIQNRLPLPRETPPASPQKRPQTQSTPPSVPSMVHSKQRRKTVLTASAAPLKRHAKAAQAFVQTCLQSHSTHTINGLSFIKHISVSLLTGKYFATHDVRFVGHALYLPCATLQRCIHRICKILPVMEAQNAPVRFR